MLFLLGAESQLIHILQRVAQRVAAPELVFYFAEYLPNLILDRIWPTP